MSIEQKMAQYSSYWSDDQNTIVFDHLPEYLRLIQLSKIRKGIQNFVYIMTNRNIPVKFASSVDDSETSYTTGDIIHIASNIHKGKEYYDVEVGVALHEAGHCIYSLDLLAIMNLIFISSISFQAHEQISAIWRRVLYNISENRLSKHVDWENIINETEYRKYNSFTFPSITKFDVDQERGRVGVMVNHPLIFELNQKISFSLLEKYAKFRGHTLLQHVPESNFNLIYHSLDYLRNNPHIQSQLSNSQSSPYQPAIIGSVSFTEDMIIDVFRHIPSSDFKNLPIAILDILFRKFLAGEYLNQHDTTKDCEAEIVKLLRLYDSFKEDLKIMINFLEDRKIDDWCWETAGGYRPYLKARYNHHFYNKIVDIKLQEKNDNPTVMDYRFHIINMMNKYASPSALPGLKEIWDIIDLSNIKRYRKFDASPTKLPTIITDAIKILEIIYENACVDETDYQNNRFQYSHDEESTRKPWDRSFESVIEEYENISQKEAQEIIDKIGKQEIDRLARSHLKHQDENSQLFMRKFSSEQRVNDHEDKLINFLEESGTDYSTFDVNLDNNVIGRTLGTYFYSTNWKNKKCMDLRYPYIGGETAGNIAAYDKGIILGKVLLKKLKITNDSCQMKNLHQPKGKLSKRLVHKISYNAENLFEIIEMNQYKPLHIELSIDTSGSMAGYKLQQAITLSTALMYLSKKLSNFSIRVSVRGGDMRNTFDVTERFYTNITGGIQHVGETLYPFYCGVIFDSQKDSIQNIEVVKHLVVCGGTPEGLAFQSFVEKFLKPKTSDIEYYFINISDGMPYMTLANVNTSSSGKREIGYSGLSAYNHTKRQVEKIRKLGYKVLSHYICDKRNNGKSEHDGFIRMYGESASFVTIDNIPKISNILNHFFFGEG